MFQETKSGTQLHSVSSDQLFSLSVSVVVHCVFRKT